VISFNVSVVGYVEYIFLSAEFAVYSGEGCMDTSSQDIVSPGATLSNAQHPDDDSTDYQWQLSSVGAVYQLNSSGTVGYINSTNDADIYYVPDSVGAPGTVDDDRWVYIVTARQPIGYAFASLGDGGIGDADVAQNPVAPDNPYASVLENYSGPLSLEAYYFEDNVPSANWLFFTAQGVSGLKYAVASTPQEALDAYNNLASTSESLYGGSSVAPPPPPPVTLAQPPVGLRRANTAAAPGPDILFQNTNGQVAIWDMDGTNVIGGGVVNLNPGSAWQAFGTGEGALPAPGAIVGVHVGIPAIFFQNTSTDQIVIWDMSGTNVVGGGAVSLDPGPSWDAIGTGDFNADGLSDILFQNTDGQVAIWDMNGANVIAGGTVSANPGPSWEAIGTGDFNDDGHSDILFQNTSGQIAIWDMNSANVIGGGTVSANPGPGWQAIGTGDFNGDDRADILFQNASSGQLAIWEMNGTSIIGGGVLSANPGPSWRAIGTDGGGSDILFQNTSGQTAIWDMSGTNVTGGGAVSANPGTSWKAIGLT
jgi:FG-GAP-like repeat